MTEEEFAEIWKYIRPRLKAAGLVVISTEAIEELQGGMLKFRRITHEGGKVKPDIREISRALVETGWITCDIHMIEPEWQSLDHIVRAHREYDEQWAPEGHGFTIADILAGLAILIRLGAVEASEWATD